MTINYAITNNLIYSNPPNLFLFPHMLRYSLAKSVGYDGQQSVADVNQEILYDQLLSVEDFLINFIKLPFK
jgi:hypothetical protein